MKVLKVIGGIIGTIAIIAIMIALSFGREVLSLKWKKYFAPKHENVRREVFEATHSYNKGKAQELIKYRLEYLRATSDEEKSAIASTIRMSFAGYDASGFPYELKQFLNEVM